MRRHLLLASDYQLGGSRWRLARLLLVESLMLSFAAGTVGAAAAAALLRAIPMLLVFSFIIVTKLLPVFG